MQSSWHYITSLSMCFACQQESMQVNVCSCAQAQAKLINFIIMVRRQRLSKPKGKTKKFRYSVIDKSQVVWLDLCCPRPCNGSYLFGLFSPSPPAWWDNLDTRWTHLSSSWLQPFIVINMSIRKCSFCPRWLLPGSWLHCPRPLSPSACQGAPILHCQSQC